MNGLSHAVPMTEIGRDLNSKLKKSTTLKSMEEEHIRDLLDRHHGNRKKVADALGISERTVYRKLKSLGIN
jgi:transcriptional regulator with PAS, ATPase and Fis domain